jgi:hypothetical protein
MSSSQSVSTAQTERVRRDWVQMAGGDPVTGEYIKGTFYGFCCELAAYRIERKYNCRPKCEAAFSQNRGTWYVRLGDNEEPHEPPQSRNEETPR